MKHSLVVNGLECASLISGCDFILPRRAATDREAEARKLASCRSRRRGRQGDDWRRSSSTIIRLTERERERERERESVFNVYNSGVLLSGGGEIPGARGGDARISVK
jgi:hypothetical protein